MFGEPLSEKIRLDIAATKELEFDEDYGPSPYELQEYLYAVGCHRDHARYGLPYGGGHKNQPVRWKIAMDCIAEALRHADLEAQLWADTLAAM